MRRHRDHAPRTAARTSEAPLSVQPEPTDGTTPGRDTPSSEDADTRPATPPDPGTPPGDDPGVFEATRRVRAGAMGLAQAHIDLLKAELAVAGRQLGVIIGMALAILVLAVLTGLLIVIGSWLFLGEWLFGSMGWGILHGSLWFIALAVPLALDLAGGWRGATTRGLGAGLLVTLVLWILFASNVLRDTAVRAGEAIEPSFAIEPAIWPSLVGFAVGALLVGIAGLVMLWRSGSVRGRQLLVVVGALAVVGGLVGAILGSVTFDTKGALAIALTIGLVTWIGVMVAVAAARGFDPEARYAGLKPTESIAMAEETKTFLERQWRRQRRKVLGR
ncbi:MAG: phage holin family protein [Chloroflexi bacterium]|nr:phage holin family protein [Chloroflexota bacterium]